ncbi:hypothetical protein ACFDTO_33840 [Microbacteriaceae bacterium 4G12]
MLTTNQMTELALTYEKEFSLNEYNGNILSASSCAVKIGSIPVLLSVPHTTNHSRNNKIKFADIHTGSIGHILQSLTNCHLIYTTRISDKDPNYDEECTYKQLLSTIITSYDIQIVLDIHGAALHREFDIDIGTNHHQAIDVHTVQTLQTFFHKHHIEDVRIDDTFKATHDGTITSYVHRLHGIHAAQLEINSRLRNPATSVTEYQKIIASLRDIILFFSKGDTMSCKL